MAVINLATQRLQRWLRMQLVDVRRLGLSVANAREELYARLENHCAGNRLFFVEVYDKLAGIQVVFASSDYTSEETITVKS